MNVSIILYIVLLWLTPYIFTLPIDEDKPCAAKPIPGKSVVCVCNSTYCDELTRLAPAHDEYIVYTSSESGARYQKNRAKLQLNPTVIATYDLGLILNPCTKYQKINGFGAAVSDSTGINWVSLPEAQRQFLVDSYYGVKGNGYNLLRVPIGGSDFSVHEYAYNETPENDMNLSNYTLAFEDYQYKIPMIKACLKASSTQVKLIASTWSPPNWMKEHSDYSICGKLSVKYLQTYADYQLKFVELYDLEGIPIWAITTSNEPSNGFLPIKSFNCLGWTASRMGLWIANHLGPLIRNSKHKTLKILAVDDQRYHITLWFNEILERYPLALEYIDGVALHWYGNAYSPPELLNAVTQRHPSKFILATEACEGAMPWQTPKVDLGSWERAETYIRDIMINLNYNVTGWMDWNMCLNEQGGPTWNGNFVDSPIIVAAAKGEFYKQPMFYALGHFAKFITRNSSRIGVTEKGDAASLGITHVAFLTPEDTVVVVLYNDGLAKRISIRLGNKEALVDMEAKSIATVEIRISGELCRYNDVNEILASHPIVTPIVV